MSLPLVLGTTLEFIPCRNPYLTPAHRHTVATWDRRPSRIRD